MQGSIAAILDRDIDAGLMPVAVAGEPEVQTTSVCPRTPKPTIGNSTLMA